MATFVSSAAIERLVLAPKMTINDRLRAGGYGSTFVLRGVRYAALAEVELHHGVTFDDARR